MDNDNESIYKAPDSELHDEENYQFEYAGFWIRVAASIIDTLIIVAITFPLMGMLMLDGNLMGGVFGFFINYVFPAIAVILFWLYKSATPGKMVFNLKIININTGEKPYLGQLIGRYLGYYVSVLPLLLGIIWVAFDSKKQGWHDKLAATAVVKVS